MIPTRSILNSMIGSVSLTACGGVHSEETPGHEISIVEFQRILEGESPGIPEERLEIIRDQQAWNQYWEDLDVGLNWVLPPIRDFEEEMAIAVHLGSRESTGYRVKFTKIENQTKELVIHYNEIQPGEGYGVLTVLTYPFEIVKLKRIDKEVRFVKSVTLYSPE